MIDPNQIQARLLQLRADHAQLQDTLPQIEAEQARLEEVRIGVERMLDMTFGAIRELEGVLEGGATASASASELASAPA